MNASNSKVGPATALITGASSGIGKALARIHAERGGDLIIVARRAEALSTLKSELEERHSIAVMTISQDLTAPDAAETIYNHISHAGSHVDILINNAGFGGIGLFHERKLAEELSMIQLNVMALTALTHRFLPGMIARGHGKILNVSSTASLIPGPGQAVYFATKAFVTSFSNAIAEELRRPGVTVTALLPGPTETEFGDISGMSDTAAFNQTASAREVAEAGYQAMLDGKLNIIAGMPWHQRILMNIMPLLPKKLVLKKVRQLQTSK